MTTIEALNQFRDGYWHSVEARRLALGFFATLALAFGVGRAIGAGLMEQQRGDPCWVRLTAAGRDELERSTAGPRLSARRAGLERSKWT